MVLTRERFDQCLQTIRDITVHATGRLVIVVGYATATQIYISPSNMYSKIKDLPSWKCRETGVGVAILAVAAEEGRPGATSLCAPDLRA